MHSGRRQEIVRVQGYDRSNRYHHSSASSPELGSSGKHWNVNHCSGIKHRLLANEYFLRHRLQIFPRCSTGGRLTKYLRVHGRLSDAQATGISLQLTDKDSQALNNAATSISPGAGTEAEPKVIAAATDKVALMVKLELTLPPAAAPVLTSALAGVYTLGTAQIKESDVFYPLTVAGLGLSKLEVATSVASPYFVQSSQSVHTSTGKALALICRLPTNGRSCSWRTHSYVRCGGNSSCRPVWHWSVYIHPGAAKHPNRLQVGIRPTSCASHQLECSQRDAVGADRPDRRIQMGCHVECRVGHRPDQAQQNLAHRG